MSKPRIDGGGWVHGSIKPDRPGSYEAWIVGGDDAPEKQFVRDLTFGEGGRWPKGVWVLAWREFAIPSTPKYVTEMIESLQSRHDFLTEMEARVSQIKKRKANERTAAHRPGTVQHADGPGG